MVKDVEGKQLSGMNTCLNTEARNRYSSGDLCVLIGFGVSEEAGPTPHVQDMGLFTVTSSLCRAL